MLLLLRFIRIAFSVVTLMLMARYFGVSVEMDVWIVTTTVLSTVTMSVWGPLNETFRAKFIFLRQQEGEERTLARVRSLLLFVILATLVVSVVMALVAGYLPRLVAPSLDGEGSRVFVLLLLMLIPSMLINELVSMGTSILNAYDVFFVPEVMGVVSALINIACIALLAPVMGIQSLVVALYLSTVLLLVIIGYFLKRHKVSLWRFSGRRNGSANADGRGEVLQGMSANADGRGESPSPMPQVGGRRGVSWDEIKPFIFFSIPFFFPYIVSQFNMLLENNRAGQLGVGVVSVLNYAAQFKTILQAVFTSVLATVMVPSLSARYADRDAAGFSGLVKDNVQLLFFFIALIIPFLVGAALPISQLFYGNSEISAQSIGEIAYLLRFYSLAVISVMLYLIFGLALLSQEKGKTYAILGVVSQVLSMALCVAFYRQMGALIFPVALIVSHLAAGIRMFVKLDITNRRTLLSLLGRYVGATLLLAGALMLVAPLAAGVADALMGGATGVVSDATGVVSDATGVAGELLTRNVEMADAPGTGNVLIQLAVMGGALVILFPLVIFLFGISDFSRVKAILVKVYDKH